MSLNSPIASKLCKCKFVLPLAIVTLILAVYWLPFFSFEPQIPAKPVPSSRLAATLFDFTQPPLRATSGDVLDSARAEKLFEDQLHGAEAFALDSQGNLYTAIDGGFVLFAHLNKSSVARHNFLQAQLVALASQVNISAPVLLRVADLSSPHAQLLPPPQTYQQQQQQQQSQLLASLQKKANGEQKSSKLSAKSCLLDEQLYGSQQQHQSQTTPTGANGNGNAAATQFSSSIVASRCSKPLGIRLSADESHLYVVDTLRGLFKVNLRVAERPHATLRSVTRLLEFKHNSPLTLPVFNYNHTSSPLTSAKYNEYINVTLMAVDDLVIEPSVGGDNRKADILYMSLGSQRYPAMSIVYQVLEGIPSGALLRYDTTAHELSVFDPQKVAHVRHATPSSATTRVGGAIGAPQFNVDDTFDDRPLNFPNGIELTSDRTALLVAESINKRIIKHYIRGPRAGDTDLWTWLPILVDNIRRSIDSDGKEVYWTIGCGEDLSTKWLSFDLVDQLMNWPRVRKFFVKACFALGTTIESLGSVLRSTSMMNTGHQIKTVETLLPAFCSRFIAIELSADGEILRTVHNDNFPRDFRCFSHVAEVIDNEQHFLYLGSPMANYLGRLKLLNSSRL